MFCFAWLCIVFLFCINWLGSFFYFACLLYICIHFLVGWLVFWLCFFFKCFWLCAMCSHVNCLDPTHLVSWLLVNLPHLCQLVTLLICSLYNLLVFAVLCEFTPMGYFLFVDFILFLIKPYFLLQVSPRSHPFPPPWQNEVAIMRTQQRMGLRRPPPPTLSSPLYERILQFKTLSSLCQQGTDMRRFALEFSGAAEGLGCNLLLCDTIYIYIYIYIYITYTCLGTFKWYKNCEQL